MAFFCFFQSTVAQQDIEIVKVKNDDRTVNLSAINHSEVPYEVTFGVQLTGMVSSADMPISFTITPKQTIAIATISPTEKQTKYTIDCQATPSTEEAKSFTKVSPEITINIKRWSGKKYTAYHLSQ